MSSGIERTSDPRKRIFVALDRVDGIDDVVGARAQPAKLLARHEGVDHPDHLADAAQVAVEALDAVVDVANLPGLDLANRGRGGLFSLFKQGHLLRL